MSIRQTIWRTWLWGRWQLFQGHRHNRLVVEQVRGMPILVLPGVMNPKLFRTGEFLAQTLNGQLIGSETAVLDMGTGTGIGALAAARWAQRVVGVDINETAVRCARINVLLNQQEEKVTIHHGDLFAPVLGQRFDRILFNPPFFRGTPNGGFSTAWRANDTVERFAAGLAEQLTADGYALVILSTDGDLPGFLQTFAANQLQTTIAAQRDMGNEILTVYRLSV
ncbi:MAG: methyltransferase [Ardenticatenaceae bacterium]|nr:methyltransferase [Ardenticatenaceae bacterium]